MTRITAHTSRARSPKRSVERPADSRGLARGQTVMLALLSASIAWCYWPVIASLIKDWHGDPNYSVGQLVPFAALYLVWHDRDALRKLRIKVCWWGLLPIVVAFRARHFGMLHMYESAERYSLLLTIVGAVLLAAGWRIAWRSRWILLFLFLMVPLPGRIHNMISGPLQTYATTGTVFVLELFGMTVSREGNSMVLNDSVPIAVAEACSGLRMLTAFIVVSAVLAYIANRPTWQKVTLVASSIPIAIVCNLARLSATAVLFVVADSATAKTFFHDFAGVSMMPLAVALMVAVLWLMRAITIPEAEPSRS